MNKNQRVKVGDWYEVIYNTHNGRQKKTIARCMESYAWKEYRFWTPFEKEGVWFYARRPHLLRHVPPVPNFVTLFKFYVKQKEKDAKVNKTNSTRGR